jgi:phosphotransferase system enzyme I (PtsI)
VTTARGRGATIAGVGLSPGIAVGPICYLENELGEVPRRKLAAAGVPSEVERLRAAFRDAEEEFRRQRSMQEHELTESERGIFQAHLEVYRDDHLRDSVEERIRSDRLNAEAALEDEIRHLGEVFARMDDSPIRERMRDVRDVGTRIQRVLLRREQAALSAGQPVILYARELLPTDTLTLDRSRLLGLLTEVGGVASHVAILARASGIPAVSGVRGLAAIAPPGCEVVIDGGRGRVIAAPRPREREAALRARESFTRERRRLTREAATRGSERERGVSLLLNIENFDHLDDGVLASVDGVGLYRTEFLFMGRHSFPTEDEQLAFYRDVLRRMDGREVTFRTIDVGGDKPLSYLVTPPEQNPALGWRGIRLTFEWPDLLIPQLRALLRAAALGPLKILLPMVTNVEEIRHARALVAELRADLERAGIEHGREVALGAMIEVAAAALAADVLLEEADFLSIGTNDLLQYLFAVDRNNLRVAGLYQPLHPVVLGLLRSILRAAAAKGKEVTVCGEMAGEPLEALALFGLGLRRFSMSPSHVPEARRVFRSFTPEEAELLVRSLDALRTASEVEETLSAVFKERARAPGRKPA